MTEPRVEYIGPGQGRLAGPTRKSWLKRISLPFILVVVVPTLLSAIYLLLIASPRYVSEARFVVRTASGGGVPTSFGLVLQGVGLSSAQTEAFAVHEYVRSGDAVKELKRQMDLPAVLARPGADLFSRYPRPWESRSDESLQNALHRFVEIGFDSTTGISTLRVQAFRPDDARKISMVLLDGGENLVNRLNQRSSSNALKDARAAEAEAQRNLDEIQRQITALRNNAKFIDPARTATESGQLIGELMATVAAMKAERSQLASQAPESPLLPGLDGRIAAFERQIETERSKIAGSPASLAPVVGAYEDLNFRRNLAVETLTQASSAVLVAEQQSKRQQLYLEQIVAPSQPDEASEPKRWIALLTIFTGLLLVYAVGWLVVAGMREHRQS